MKEQISVRGSMINKRSKLCRHHQVYIALYIGALQHIYFHSVLILRVCCKVSKVASNSFHFSVEQVLLHLQPPTLACQAGQLIHIGVPWHKVCI